MYLVKFILLCFGGAFIGASLFRLKFEKSIIILLMGITVILYQAYILDAVYICSVGIVSGMVIGGVSGIIKMIREKTWRDIMEKVFSPLSVSYVTALALIWYIVRFNQVSLIDELHLWGALPKILFSLKGKQQLTDSLLLGYNDYIPGMPLFLYFLEFVNGSFKEALLYFGYAAFGNILLLEGIFEKLDSYKKWYYIPVASITTCLLPLMFYNNLFNDHAIYYKSLHIDAVLGLFIAYATWLLGRKSWEKMENAVCFSLSLTMIILLKSSGILFAAIIGTAAFFNVVLKDKKYIKRILWVVMFPFAAYLEWSLFLKIKSIGLTTEYSVADIFLKEHMGKFLELLSHRELIYLPQTEKIAGLSTFWGIFIILCILMTAICFIVRKPYHTFVNGVMIVQVIVFTAGLYGLYAGAFHGTELSYARYICTALTAFLCFLAMFLGGHAVLIKKELTDGKRKAFFIGIPILLLLALFPKMRPQGIAYPLQALRDADEAEILINSTQEMNPADRETILLVMDEAYNSFSPDLYLYFWRRLYFDFLDENKKVEKCIFTAKYIDKIEKREENNIEMQLLEGCDTEDFDYIYKVHYIDDDNKEGELFRVKDRTKETYYLESAGQGEF